MMGLDSHSRWTFFFTFQNLSWRLAVHGGQFFLSINSVVSFPPPTVSGDGPHRITEDEEDDQKHTHLWTL